MAHLTERQAVNELPVNRVWLWPSEVAAICHVSRKTVYAWIEAGKIQTILKIRPFKIPREEVQKLLR